MERTKGVNGVVAPVGFEREAPLPDRGHDRVRVPQPQPSPDVTVDVEYIIRQGARHRLLQVIGVEDLPVAVEVVEPAPVGWWLRGSLDPSPPVPKQPRAARPRRSTAPGGVPARPPSGPRWAALQLLDEGTVLAGPAYEGGHGGTEPLGARHGLDDGVPHHPRALLHRQGYARPETPPKLGEQRIDAHDSLFTRRKLLALNEHHAPVVQGWTSLPRRAQANVGR